MYVNTEFRWTEKHGMGKTGWSLQRIDGDVSTEYHCAAHTQVPTVPSSLEGFKKVKTRL